MKSIYELEVIIEEMEEETTAYEIHSSRVEDWMIRLIDIKNKIENGGSLQLGK